MKQRFGFVSNSSSTAFVVANKTKEPKTMEDFAEETVYLVEQFRKEYGFSSATEEDFIASANSYPYEWAPKETHICSFGDEDGTTLGEVLDYMLRDGGESKSFKWKFHHWER